MGGDYLVIPDSQTHAKRFLSNLPLKFIPVEIKLGLLGFGCHFIIIIIRLKTNGV